MTMYIDITKDNEFKDKEHYKQISLAWDIDNMSNNLQKLIDKNYHYFTYDGKKEDILEFNLVNRNYSVKKVLKGTRLFDFLFRICNKFVWVKYEDDIAYFNGNEKDYTHKEKGYAMIKFEVLYYDRPYTLKLLKSQFSKHNFKLRTKIPVKRSSKGNLMADYPKLDEKIGLTPNYKKWNHV